MNESPALRMLFSHNFDLADDRVPFLSREAFTQVFVEGFSTHPEIQCRQVDSPHWIVEIVCRADLLTPEQVGATCAQMLVNSRTQSIGMIDFDILVLGGIKTTPATSDAPDALQTNQWGVDIVETKSGEQFLRSIGWESTIAGKPVGTIFKVEVTGR